MVPLDGASCELNPKPKWSPLLLRNERTGTSAFSVDETFTDKVEYSTEKPVSQITVQGILYSKENATITLQIKKDGESVFNQSKQLEAVPGIDTTVDLVYSTIK